MARILVVGASGFVGAHVTRRLCDDGHEICGFAPEPEPCLTAADIARITFVRGDVTEAAALDAAITDFAPDLAIGLAAWGGGGNGLMAAAQADPERARAVNADGFRNLLEACRVHGVQRMLWSSTGAVFGNPRLYPPDGVVDEASAPAPETAYGETKRQAEEIARHYRSRHGLAVTGVRLPVVFGPGLWYRGAAGAILQLFEAAATGGQVALTAPPEPFDLVYVKDVARAFAFLAQAPGPLDAIYHLHAAAPTMRELVSAVRSLAPDLDAAVADKPAQHVFPVMRGARLQALGFTPAWALREACRDYLGELRR